MTFKILSFIIVLSSTTICEPIPISLFFTNVNSAFTVTSDSGKPFYRLVTSSNTSIEECAESAMLWKNESAPNEKCLSATFFKAPSNISYTKQCWCYILPKWIPMSSNEADSVQIIWPCSTSEDCSFNGDCNSQESCTCIPGWKGPRCGELDLQTVDIKNPGLRLVDDNGHNISTWGAPILQDEVSGLWHAWASEMLYSCGINSWETNSHIIHAISYSPFGPWTRLEEVVPAFAHEPDVIKGPNGELIMVYSYFQMPTNSNSSSEYCTQCANGITLYQDVKNGCGLNKTHIFHQMMMISPGFNQKWQEPIEITKLTAPWDWNLALTVLKNGTAIGLVRALFPWNANNYSDNTTWHSVGGSPEGKALPDSNVEDPALWTDTNGIFHAIFHSMDVYGQSNQYLGGHAYSVDGVNWVYSGTAYSNYANYSDNSWQIFLRRERPHPIFSSNGTLVALSNGVQYETTSNVTCKIGNIESPCDPIFTLVVPVRH